MLLQASYCGLGFLDLLGILAGSNELLEDRHCLSFLALLGQDPGFAAQSQLILRIGLEVGLEDRQGLVILAGVLGIDTIA